MIKNDNIIKNNLDNKYSAINEETRIRNFNGYPRELSDFLSQSDCCKKVLRTQDYANWIHLYTEYAGYCTMIGRVSREYVLISLAHILNELKELEGFQLEYYTNDTPSLLIDVIMKARGIKGWDLDRDSALGLCSQIICDYMEDKIIPCPEYADKKQTEDGVIFVDQTSEVCALEQIISRYPEDAIYNMHNPVWEWFYVELKYNGEEELNDEELHEKYDIKSMKAAVCERKLLPNLCKGIIV